MHIQLQNELLSLKNPKKAVQLQRFFKTGKGEYGEGDRFLGIVVPILRKTAKKYTQIQLNNLAKLIQSPIHEHRLISLFILIDKYKISSYNGKKKYVDFYLEHISWVNNWDLVDLSAPHILGDYLLHKDKKQLYDFAGSPYLWKKRIAIIACLAFIKKGSFSDCFNIALLLMHDSHDLIHKAVGWMLREIGKRSQQKEEEFLKKYYINMPRTMLRYAIERFPESKRQQYLKGKITVLE